MGLGAYVPAVADDSLEAATVVVLVGPSSAGKTTAAHDLRHRLARPSIFLSGDDLDLPQSSEAVAYLRSLQPAELLAWERRFYDAFFGALTAVQAAGLHAIGEMIFKNASHFVAFQEAVEGVPHLLVRLTASEQVRLDREQRRVDREAGTAARTANEEFVPPDVDLTIDTSTSDVDRVVALILSRLRPGSTGSA
jgi:chloramphenicol 3-O-phosphotransferase